MSKYDADNYIMSPKDVAEMLGKGIGESTVKRLMREGEIPARKIGRNWRTTSRLLLEYVERGACGATDGRTLDELKGSRAQQSLPQPMQPGC